MVKVLESNFKEELNEQISQVENSQENQGGKQCSRKRTHLLLLGIGILICITIPIIGLAGISATRFEVVPDLNYRNVPNTTFEFVDHFKRFSGELITRQQWKARKADFRIDTLNAPVPYVIIHQTSTESCTTLTDCKKQVRQIEDIHINSKRLSDISYNFLVGGDDGYIFEARGWTKVGTHINQYNTVSIGIAFIGLFEDKLPSNASLSATRELIITGMEENYIKKDYKLFGMRQLSNSINNPGQKLYDVIKKWPHWSYGLELD